MLISVNDIPEMREAFAGLHIEGAEVRYIVGGNVPGRAAAKELIIRNWRDK